MRQLNKDMINLHSWTLASRKLTPYRISFMYFKYTEVGIANFFLSPLIANPLIYFGVRLTLIR